MTKQKAKLAPAVYVVVSPEEGFTEYNTLGAAEDAACELLEELNEDGLETHVFKLVEKYTIIFPGRLQKNTS